MLLVISPNRLLLGSELKKAFERGPKAGHKYTKRERIYVKGKPSWRYFYGDEGQKEKGSAAIDPQGAHEHALISHLAKFYENLRSVMKKASDINPRTIRESMGAAATTVRITDAFNSDFHEPFVAREVAGHDPVRGPLQRVQHAMELLPDHIKEMISLAEAHAEGGKARYKGLSELVIEHGDKDKDILKGAAGWAQRTSGELHLIGKGDASMMHGFLGGGLGGVDGSPPRFRSPLTWTEEVVWHEAAHHVHYRMEDADPALWKSWSAVSMMGQRISDYAHTNTYEDFAESFACMMSHPKQMAEQCPERYEWIRKNLLPGPSVEEILQTPDTELQWWNQRKRTKAAKVLDHSIRTTPRPLYIEDAYHSQLDQFFVINTAGRNLYVRVGPRSKDEEDGWERMPETLDEATGLPKFETALANRWRNDSLESGVFKEIFDEKGNPLTPNEAYIYLRQDEESLNEKLPEAAPDYKGSELHSLGRLLFDSLGGNPRKDDEGNVITDEMMREKERARVAKARETGKDPLQDRHRFAPHEIPRDEFYAKSGTFQFGAFKEAIEQPAKLYKNGVLQLDPHTGKPLLAVRRYEQENPDGTIARIDVNQVEPFSRGDKIKVPSFRAVNGQMARVWDDYEVGPGEDTAQLAAKFNCEIDELLEKNGRARSFQIVDPILASLINPNGDAIRDEYDLHKLIRNAAQNKRRSWITVPTGTTVLHLEVEFDGAGPPVIVGDYWKRRLGKEKPRTTDLLTALDEVKWEKIKERRPKKVPAEVGRTVKVIADGKSVYATIKKAENIDGKPHYEVEPLTNQGIANRKPFTTTSVKQIAEDELPRTPNVRRRLVNQLQADVLVYADKIVYDKRGRPMSATFKILPPKNNSVPQDEIGALGQFVRRVETETVDGDTIQELTISLDDIPLLREKLGGFVMDDITADLLAGAGRKERELKKISEGAQVVELHQLDKPGDGVLKGLMSHFPDGTQFELGQHQKKALQALAKNGGRLIAAHFMGTGKTLTSIAGVKMMQNLEDPQNPGKPHPNRPKRVCVVVPLNTIYNWSAEVEKATGKAPTLIGANTLAGAQQVMKRPDRKAGESDSAYEQRVAKLREQQMKEGGAGGRVLWDPGADTSDIVVIPQEYWAQNEEELRKTGGFDGLIIDEAQGVQNENERSSAVERWNPDMKMLMLLSGTPITNRLNTIPRYLRLISKGAVDLGSPKDFEENYLVESAVMKANGSKNAAKTDLNPGKAAKLASLLRQYMHVATTQDVEDKVMPAVLIDENKPAHMAGQQARVYRMFMAALTPDEMEQLEQSAAVGEDERSLLSPNARKKLQWARSIANSPGYKPPEDSEYATYVETEIVPAKKKNEPATTKERTYTYTLPTHDRMTAKRPEGFGSKWPTERDVSKGVIKLGEYLAMKKFVSHVLGVSYDAIEGQAIDKKMLADIKAGVPVGPHQHPWPGKIRNPEYGPEGAICRGRLEDDGTIHSLTYWHEGQKIEVPVGTRFIRDPAKKAAGVFYHQDDWDFDSGGVGGSEGGDGGEGGDEGDAKEDKPAGGKYQRPKAGRENESVQRSPRRRRERLMFDLTMAGHSVDEEGNVSRENAKAAELETYIKNSLRENPDKQMIVFGNLIGSSVRTVEAKMRLMGYQDVNEALGHEDWSSDDDKGRPPPQGKYFVTYFGKGATLGDRDLNSEIFRKKKDEFGRDTDTSMLVHRTMTGTVGKPPAVGQFKEGWTKAQRKKIADMFPVRTEPGKPKEPLEVPMRVTSMLKGSNAATLGYVYESAFKKSAAGRRDFARIEELELKRKGAPVGEKKKIDAEMGGIFSKYVSEQPPLTRHQIHVFNNTQFMVASDAAQVGLNWGNATDVVMYDSLFSPMNEWQRITRAARMLPPAVRPEVKKDIAQLRTFIAEEQKKNGFKEWANKESAMAIVGAAFDKLDDESKTRIADTGYDPIALCEAYLANEAFERIRDLRNEVETRLRQTGRRLQPVERVDPETGETRVIEPFIKPAEITQADVMNEIIEKNLTAFEREILKSRKYLVNVKRISTSVDVPEYVTVKEVDPETGKKRKIRVPTGKWMTEVPTKAEQSIMTQARAKMVPYEKFLRLVQTAQHVDTNYDFQSTSGRALGSLSILPERLEQERKRREQKTMKKAFTFGVRREHAVSR